ncbi:MAG TPA: hypothetical protein PLC53_02565 [Bacilli bacterium]|nr:hypothetical protein [Bacilli bacterium]
MKIEEFMNAYGIKKIRIDCNEKVLNNCAIYAPNGIFKSSFAKAIYNLSEGKGLEVEDKLTGEKFKCNIEKDGQIYNENSKLENVLVYSKEVGDNNLENNIKLIGD